jgi:reactive intermediate/imine deaminase
MQLVSGPVETHVHRVFHNLSAVCEAAGGNLCDIVKLNVFLRDLKHFEIVNRIMAEYFDEPYPARAVVEVNALPRDALIEMDGIMIA